MMNEANNKEANSGGGGGGGGPCGACKFLRRKCVNGCVFAPYFEAEQGTAHFAAVHKVFGASNASKLLLRLPPQKRLDAVLTLSYEALARLRDPVYGCVAHIFTLQQQVVNLQAELAYVQARLSTLQRSSAALVSFSHNSQTSIGGQTSDLSSTYQPNILMHLEHPLHPQTSSETTSFYSPLDLEDGELQALGRQLVSQCSAAEQRFRSCSFN